MISGLVSKVSKEKKRIFAMAMTLALGVSSAAQLPAMSADLKLQNPTNRPFRRSVAPRPDFQPDVLLVVTDAKADKDEIKEALEEVHATATQTVRAGNLEMMLIKTEKGKLVETETKLTKDKKHFSAVGRNYRFAANAAPNDKDFNISWHLAAMHCPKAWDHGTGGAKVAVLDTGCESNGTDLQGKVEKGFDANTVAAQILGGLLLATGTLPGVTDLAGAAAAAASGGAKHDQHGHGTWVASCIAATMNNGVTSAGIAPSSTIYPIRVADGAAGSKPMATDFSVACAMAKVFTSGARIVNLSYGAPYVGFHEPTIHAPLHKMFSEFYYARQGILFLSAGNDSVFDGTVNLPYINMVSAINRNGSLTDFSNYGTIVDFTAPGEEIICMGIDGGQAKVKGTSFSSPIVAGVAALILSKNPALPNFVVEQILRQSCVNSTAGWNGYYGWGMPDAAKALQLTP
jgi:thermitase